jgi:hypothetical protein
MQELIKNKEKSKMSEFKVGDWVRCKDSVKESCDKNFQRYFEGVKKINGITTDIFGRMVINLAGENTFFYLLDDLELVCGFVKGQEIEVRTETSSWLKKAKFYSYDPELEEPFLALNEYNGINNWKYARAIEPEYKAYTEPKLEWLRKIIIDKETNRKFIISSISKSLENEYILFSTIGTNLSMSIRLPILFRDYTWSDGSPCGELKD